MLFARFLKSDPSRNVKVHFSAGLEEARKKIVAAVRSEKFREISSVLAVLALASIMLFPALRGDWPIGHDHPAHLFRIWQLRETILHHLMPWSWSHRWFAGYPQNIIYPIGADLFVLAVQALSLGKLSLGAAYGLAFWLFYFLYGYAAFFFVRRAVDSRVAGLIAVVFLLTDPGNNDIGGWFWLVDLGVWTMALGLVPALIGTVRIAALLEKPEPKTAAAIGLCVGLALLCHPFFLIYFGIAIPLLCASRYFSGEETYWKHAFILLGLGSVSGLLIASFWLVPYLSASAYASEIGWTGSSLSEIGAAIGSATLFPRMHPLAAIFGLVGSLFLLRTRRTLPLFMGLFTFVCIVGSSSTFAELAGPGVTEWLNTHIITTRLLMLVKPFWYGAGAFLLVASWKTLDQFLPAPGKSTKSSRQKLITRLAMIVFVCAFVLSILFFSFAVFFENEVRRPTQWHSQRDDIAARRAFVAWAKDQWSHDSKFFRVVHGFDQDEHSLTDLGIELPYPFYKIYITPTGHFKYNLGSGSNAALRAVNVRFALSEHALPARPDFRLLKMFDGKLWLYEFRDWNSVPFEITGGGPVELTRFDDEDVELNAEPGAHGLLRLNVTYFPKWRATRDANPIPIKAVPAAGVEHSAFMEVELAPGIYHFHYQKTWSDYLGNVFCLLGVAGCGLLANWKRLFRTEFSHF